MPLIKDQRVIKLIELSLLFLFSTSNSLGPEVTGFLKDYVHLSEKHVEFIPKVQPTSLNISDVISHNFKACNDSNSTTLTVSDFSVYECKINDKVLQITEYRKRDNYYNTTKYSMKMLSKSNHSENLMLDNKKGLVDIMKDSSNINSIPDFLLARIVNSTLLLAPLDSNIFLSKNGVFFEWKDSNMTTYYDDSLNFHVFIKGFNVRELMINEKKRNSN